MRMGKVCVTSRIAHFCASFLDLAQSSSLDRLYGCPPPVEFTIFLGRGLSGRAVTVPEPPSPTGAAERVVNVAFAVAVRAGIIIVIGHWRLLMFQSGHGASTGSTLICSG
jgi:hypothetical protein